MHMRNAVLKHHAILAAVGMVLMGVGSIQAAPVNWAPVEAISGDSDVSVNGTLLGAFNFAGDETTVNGVTFKKFAVGAPQVVSVTVDSLYTLSIVPERAEHTLTTFDTSFPGVPFTNLSSAYQSLLGASAGSNFADRSNMLVMDGLTIGQGYEFQAWVSDSSRNGRFSYSIVVDGLNAMDPNTARDGNGEVLAGGLGQFVIGTFVADATSQQVNFVSEEVGGGLNGFQLRAISRTQNVPEPATLALLGLGLAGLGFSRNYRERHRLS